MKYIVSINTKFGSISAESKHPEDLDGSLQILRKLARDLESGKKRKSRQSRLREKTEDNQNEERCVRFLTEKGTGRDVVDTERDRIKAATDGFLRQT